MRGSISRMSDLVQLAPGLHRWTAFYVDADPESPDDWVDEVGCVAYETAGGLVLIDPLVEPDQWTELDALAEKHAGRVAVLTTIHWHERSSAAVVERYGATTTRPPDGIRPIEFPRFRETMFWLEEHRALVPGDRLIGDGAGGLRLPPAQWLEYLDGVTLDDLRPELRQLLDLPVEMVLASHGDPVLTDGCAAIERALG
jgi:hypothetical protein